MAEDADLSPGNLRFVGKPVSAASETVKGFLAGGFGHLYSAVGLSDDLAGYQLDYWPASDNAMAAPIYQQVTSAQPISSAHSSQDGFVTPSYLQDYYFRIYVNPNPINLSLILSSQHRDIQVWNAWLTPQLLTNINALQDLGVTLAGPVQFPTVFQPLEQRSYSLDVGIDGPGAINTQFGFSFPVDRPTLTVTGTRSLVFMLEPNWQSPVTERLEWLTEVIEMRDGSEQRFRLRQNPRQTLEFEVLALREKLTRLTSTLFGWQGRPWAVPLWVHEQTLKAGAGLGATVINVPTTGREFRVGDFGILFTDEKSYETFKVKAITAASLVPEAPLAKAWGPGSRIAPVRVMRVREDLNLKYLAGNALSGAVRLQCDTNTAIAPDAWPTSYQGEPVLEVDHNWVNEMGEQWSRRLFVMDNEIGQPFVSTELDHATATRSHALRALNRQQVQAYRNLAHFMQGRWQSFWSPTFAQDFELAHDTLAGTNYLVVKYVQFTQLVKVHPARRHLRIVNGGTVYYRQITSVDDLNSPIGTETLYLDAPLPVAIPKSRCVISFLLKVRSDADQLEFSWHNPAVMDCTLQLKAIPA